MAVNSYLSAFIFYYRDEKMLDKYLRKDKKKIICIAIIIGADICFAMWKFKYPKWTIFISSLISLYIALLHAIINVDKKHDIFENMASFWGNREVHHNVSFYWISNVSNNVESNEWFSMHTMENICSCYIVWCLFNPKYFCNVVFSRANIHLFLKSFLYVFYTVLTIGIARLSILGLICTKNRVAPINGAALFLICSI